VITGIIVALSDELSSLTSKKINKGETAFINDNTLIAISGAGPKNAAKASQLLIDQGAERLISWGCAAALKAELKPGDLVIPETLHSENQEEFSIASPWLSHTLKLLSPLCPLTDSLLESSSIVGESSAKKKLHQQSTAIALDMESIAIAKTAAQYNYPALIIRCIADPVNMDLPKAINYALNQHGDVELSKLLWFVLTHPAELPGLIKLGLHFKTAKNKLKSVAKQLDTIAGFEQNTVLK